MRNVNDRIFVWAAMAAALVLSVSGCGEKAGTPSGRAKPIEIATPIDVDVPDLFGYAVVPSVDQLLKHVSAVARLFGQAEMTPETLRSKFGRMVGDPTLAGLDGGRAVVVLVFKGENPMAMPQIAGFVPVKGSPKYVKVLTSMGMQASLEGDLLLVAKTPDGLARAKANLAAYNTIAGGNVVADLRVVVRFQPVMATYGAMIKGFGPGLAGMMAMGAAANPQFGPGAAQSFATMIKGEILVLLMLAGQTDLLQIDVGLDGDSIVVNQTVAAKPNTALHDLFDVPPPPAANRSMELIAGSGTMRVSMQYDAKALNTFADALIAELSQDPQLKSILTPELQDKIKGATAWWATENSMVMNMRDGNLRMVMASRVSDGEKMLKLLDDYIGLFTGDNELGKMYQAMGITMKLDREVRTHGGVAVNQIKVNMDAGKMQPGQAKMMKGFMAPTQFAFVDGWYLAAHETGALDELIDAARSGKKLGDPNKFKARSEFGPGRHFYVDYDFIELMHSMMANMPAMPGGNPFAAMKSGHPMLFAGTAGKGNAFSEWKIPLTPFAQAAKAAKGR